MDFLKLGMKYEKSSSKVQRVVARCLLRIERWKADRYEKYLDRKQIFVSEDPEVDSALFQSICEQIKRDGHLKAGEDAGRDLGNKVE